VNINTLRQFRYDVYDCFEKAKDALFNTVDALMTETDAKSLPEVTQSLWFERHWSSVYEAFKDGKIAHAYLQKVFARYMPKPAEGNWVWIGVDVSGIARPSSVTSADRTALAVHNLPKCSRAITSGWQFSTVVALSDPTSSRTYILDQQRVKSETTANQVCVKQLRQMLPLLPEKTIVVLDRGYDSNWLWCQCRGLGANVLGRIKRKRTLYRPAPLPTGSRGTPRKDGDRLQAGNPSTYGTPDGSFQEHASSERPIEIFWWKRLHVKEARWLELTVIRVVRPHATNKERDPRESWFVWLGDPEVDIAQIAQGYTLRFGQEHGYRFDKQALMWERPRLHTPEQFERWSHIVAIAHNHLVLASPLVEPVLRPWEDKQRSPSLQQVRRGLNKLLLELGTPARPPKPRGKAKGRSVGAKVGKRPRFSVVRKKPKLPQPVPA
jgi:DDE superfamily endonuclease